MRRRGWGRARCGARTQRRAHPKSRCCYKEGRCTVSLSLAVLLCVSTTLASRRAARRCWSFEHRTLRLVKAIPEREDDSREGPSLTLLTHSQEKVRKVLGIWSKGSTFSSSALNRIDSKLAALDDGKDSTGPTVSASVASVAAGKSRSLLYPPPDLPLPTSLFELHPPHTKPSRHRRPPHHVPIPTCVSSRAGRTARLSCSCRNAIPPLYLPSRSGLAVLELQPK